MGLCYNFYKLIATTLSKLAVSSPLFMKTRIARHVAIYLFIALTGYGIGACRQNVMLSPSEDDLIVLNGCVVSACNYLAAVKTQHNLEKNFWAKILLVRYANHPAGHAYCVWETDGTIYGYDRNAGGFPIPVYTRDAKSIAVILAQELSRHLKENLSVSHADFVEPSTKVHRF
jgi:hypothetical protein